MIARSRERRKFFWGLALLAVICCIFLMSAQFAFAAGQTGTVATTALNIRSGPGTSYRSMGLLSINKEINILDTVTGNDGKTWYYMEYNGINGYVAAEFIVVSSHEEYETDAKFEAYLDTQGFPESYKPYLRTLHAKYPNWNFRAARTGLSWNDVLEREGKLGKSLVSSSAPSSWKSQAAGAYDPQTGKYTSFDSGGWAAASEKIIAYYLDPRNYINQIGIFQFLTHTYDAETQTSAGLAAVVSGTFLDAAFPETGFATYADALMEAGRTATVNPYVLASMILVEQGTSGTGKCISGTVSGYEGYYNYYNIGAYKTASMSAVTRGLWYASRSGSYQRPWDGHFASLLGGALFYSENYVKQNKNTLYFKKWNVMNGLEDVGEGQYMTNVQAAMSEGTNMGKAYTDKNQAFVFRIPVYQNMPESAVTFADKGNPNNWLSSITVDGYALTPAFSGANTSYSLVVPDSAASINVGATAVAGTSTVSGTGNYSLNYGDNTIQITCISQSGDSRTYTLIVARAGGSAGGTIQVADDAAITPFYPIGTYVTGIEPGTSASTVASGIGTQNCTVKILNADGSENTQTVGTGNKLAVYVGDTLVQQYEIVVYGDINGDGKVSNLDLVLMQKQILGIESQSGSRLEAANVSKDGGISNKDLVILQKHILGISQIDQ